MTRTSVVGLVIVGCVLSFLSALGGALLALSLDEPEIVETEYVVEVPQPDPVIEPTEEALDTLTQRYVELGGRDDEWTRSLVHEIGGHVCESETNPSVADLLDSGLGSDISLAEEDLELFLQEVRAACPEAP